MTFEEKLENYADIIVSYGLNIQKGQTLLILTEPIHRKFAGLVTKKAYEKGARYVDVSFSSYMESDPVITHARAMYSPAEDLSFLPSYMKARWDELVATESAVLSIRGNEFPDLFSDIDPQKIGMMQGAVYSSRKSFYDEGVGRSQVHWCIVCGATPEWGKKVFPYMDQAEANAELWEEIFKITRAVYPDGLVRLWELDAELKRRSAVLNEMRAEKFRFVAPGTDLTIGISPKSLFGGGTLISQRGVPFQPNIPSEEIFTSTDCRMAMGYVTASKPAMISGQIVEGLTMAFSEGDLVAFSAEEGEDVFAELIKKPGATRINELAFVGIDSPIFKSGYLFKDTLFDENAACHIALGHGFRFRYDGYEDMSEDELVALGFNPSSAHQDIMISNEFTDVFAITGDKKNIQIIKKGKWII